MEPKFRVWDKVENEMMSPAEWEENYVGGGSKKIGLYIYRSKKDPRQHSSLDWVLRHPESFILMQFTGLKDSKGVEICKDDLNKNAEGIISRIEWGLGEWALFPINKNSPVRSLYWQNICEKTQGKVIGNRFEHPGLLK